MRKSLWAVALLLLATTTGARADSITFTTPAGSAAGGQSVDASVKIVTNADGSIDITLTNFEANPTSVVQAISDLDFTLSNGATTGTLASSSGQEITVASNGTFTLGSTVSTGWALNNNVSGGLQLDVLGAPAGPSHLIRPNSYIRCRCSGRYSRYRHRDCDVFVWNNGGQRRPRGSFSSGA